MCIAIYKPAGAWASKESLRNSYESNPHGAGYAIHDGEKVVIHKGFFSFRSFWKHYKRHVTSETPALVHFRIATIGEKTTENCHPFTIGNGALMHNGPRLNWRHCSGDGARSDSRQFADDFIAGLSSAQVKRILPMIEEFIGTEKVVMMFDDGETLIAGEKQGHWADGCWWSNSSYKTYGRSPTKQLALLDDDNEYEDWWKRRGGYIQQPYKEETKVVELKPTTNRARVVWCEYFGEYIPKFMRDPVDGLKLKWDAMFSAFVPVGLSDDAFADEQYVYEMSENGEMTVVADVIETHDHLKLMIETLEPITEAEALSSNDVVTPLEVTSH